MEDEADSVSVGGPLRRAKNWLGGLLKRLTLSMFLSVLLHAAIIAAISLFLLYYGGVGDMFNARELNVTLVQETESAEDKGKTDEKDPGEKEDDVADAVEPDPEDPQAAEKEAARKAEKAAKEAAREANRKAAEESLDQMRKARENIKRDLAAMTDQMSEQAEKDSKIAAESEEQLAQLLAVPTPEEQQEEAKEEEAVEEQERDLAKEAAAARAQLREIERKLAQKTREAYEKSIAERQAKAAAERKAYEDRMAEAREKAAREQEEYAERMRQQREKGEARKREYEAKRAKIQQEAEAAEALRKKAAREANAKAMREADQRKAAAEAARRKSEGERKARLAKRKAEMDRIAAGRKARLDAMREKAARDAAEAKARRDAIRAKAAADMLKEKERIARMKARAAKRARERENIEKGNMPLGDWRGLLERDGLDVVIVFDSTDSMGREIAELKKSISRICAGYRSVVSNTHISICTYRDKGSDCEYEVKGMRLTSDIGKVQNYLKSITAGAGGDRPEAVLAGLKWAVNNSGFRSDAKKVILLFGDEPPHRKEVMSCRSVAGGFRRRKHGVIHTITCTRQTGQPALDEFQQIARAGNGQFFTSADTAKLVDQLQVLVFPRPYWNDVRKLAGQ